MRRQRYYGAVLRFTAEYAQPTGQLDALHHDLDDAGAYVKDRFSMEQQAIKAGPSLALSIITFGFYGIVWDYQLHTDSDRVYPEFHSSEDAVLDAIRAVRI